MFNWSNFDILRLLQQEPGRLREFLLEVSLDDLQAAVQEKQHRADMRYHQSRQQYAFKKNVLDMNLDVVIDLCYQQKIINFFEKKLALEKARIQNHPEYGYRLVNRCPEKYYIGDRSEHFNRARQIEEAYGISSDSDEDDSNQEANESEQGNEDSQNNSDEQQEQHDENQEMPNNEEQDDQNSANESSLGSFIASDSDFEEDELSEDSFEEKIRNRKKVKKVKKQFQSEEKVERSQEKVQISEKTTEKKLRKPVQETNQIFQLDDEYIIEPQQLNLTALQTERSKRNQKKIKQELKRLQCSFSTNPSNVSQEFTAEKEDQPFVAPRKARKMNLELE